ncbi:MAG TPA: FHA domain-containing protein [Polyangiaceae bacterium]|nr:FHA domain-containing protein [Polyangiaceae bacterium]
MAFDDWKRTAPGPRSGPDAKTGSRFWLEHQGQTIELRPGLVVVGRSSGCHLILDDALVSRRHAQFVVTAETVTVEDLGSVNGIYVNSRRVSASELLKEGDRVQIGKSEFVLKSTALPQRAREERHTAETLHGIEIPKALVRGAAPPELAAADSTAPPGDEQTRQGDVFELLGAVADKVLALGRGDEAERILSTALGNMLAEARSGRTLNQRTADRAVGYAVKIAEATGRARWVDYCFELFETLRRPLPAEVVDQLYTVVRKVSGISLPTLREYLKTLQGLASTLGPSDRFVLQRLEGLERLAAR